MSILDKETIGTLLPRNTGSAMRKQIVDEADLSECDDFKITAWLKNMGTGDINDGRHGVYSSRLMSVIKNAVHLVLLQTSPSCEMSIASDETFPNVEVNLRDDLKFDIALDEFAPGELSGDDLENKFKILADITVVRSNAAEKIYNLVLTGKIEIPKKEKPKKEEKKGKNKKKNNKKT